MQSYRCVIYSIVFTGLYAIFIPTFARIEPKRRFQTQHIVTSSCSTSSLHSAKSGMVCGRRQGRTDCALDVWWEETREEWEMCENCNREWIFEVWKDDECTSTASMTAGASMLSWMVAQLSVHNANIDMVLWLWWRRELGGQTGGGGKPEDLKDL